MDDVYIFIALRGSHRINMDSRFTAIFIELEPHFLAFQYLQRDEEVTLLSSP